SASWIALLILSANVFELALAPKPSAAAATGPTTLIFKSSDGGATWSAADTGITLVHNVGVIAVDPSSRLTLYAGTTHGVFKSIDGGNLWNAASDGLPVLSIKDLIIDPQITSTLYSLGGSALNPGPVFKSANGGLTWSAIGNSSANLIDPHS